MSRGRSPQLGEGRAALGQQTAFTAGPAWSGGHARNVATLARPQALSHALKGHLAVRMLRTPLGGRDRETAGTMGQAHARLHFVAMLPSGSAGNKKFDLAIALQ